MKDEKIKELLSLRIAKCQEIEDLLGDKSNLLDELLEIERKLIEKRRDLDA